MSVVLVTGASGFIGRHAVSALLEKGFTVHALARAPLAHIPAIWHREDLLDSDDWMGVINSVRPSHILHLAWETGHGYFWEAPENLDWVAFTLKLVRVFHNSGGKRIVAAGSCAEYDWDPAVVDTGPCHELTTPLAPATLYGTAKLATFRILSAFAEQVGLSLGWARLFLLYGPAESSARLVPHLIHSLKSRQPVKLGSGHRVRDFMDARDAGAALAAFLTSEVNGPVNVASGQPVSIAQLAATLTKLLEVDPSLVEFNAQPSHGPDPDVLTADTSRLTSEVGYSPRVSLRDGLAGAVSWWGTPTAETSSEA